MPKKKRNSALAGQSGDNPRDYNPGPNGADAVARALPGPNMSGLSLHNKDEIVRSMHDMFSHLDPDVIYIVLSEADFKVENAMDALLELSGAAEGKTTTTPSLSGFEMAAALLEPCPPHTNSSTIRSAISAASNSEGSHQELSPETQLTEEFDSLIDQELESLAMVQSQPSSINPFILPLPSESVPRSSGAPPSPLVAQEALMKLDQLDVENDFKSGSLSEQSSYPSAKIGDAQRNASPINKLSLGGVSLPQETGVSVDFSHLTLNSTCDAPRPSAFKAYHRPGEFPKQTSAPVPQSHSLQPLWNFQAPDFRQCMERPSFITPVVQAPNPWTTNPSSRTLWTPPGQAPLKPSATVPKSWMVSSQSRLRLEGQVLVLLRGAPGSGKSTYASAMLEQNPGGVVLSTDEYFTQDGVYHFKPHLLGNAHAWNHKRAKEAFEKGLTPIIIDNTNLQCWEMKPYVALAQKHKYRVLFREPNTWWKTKPRELEKHPSVNRPDLVGDPGFVKPGSYLSSSLPDVSSVGCKSGYTSGNTGSPKSNIGSHDSEEYMSSQEDVAEQIEVQQPEHLGGADYELDACTARNSEEPVLFAESIGQRVKRVRQQTRTEDGDASTLDMSDSVNKASQDDSVDDYTVDAVSLNTEKLIFVGDWPSESLEQRGRKSTSHKAKNPNEETANFEDDVTKPDDTFLKHFNSETPNKTEFQKLLDILQGDNYQITQETTQDFLPLGGDRNHSVLASEDQPVLPECVLDRKSEISNDPGNGNTHSPSPIKELETSQDESSKRGTKEACADVDTPANGVTGLETGSEHKDKTNSNANLSLSSGGEVEYSSESSQERRKVHSRRAGKSCKLALTFMHQTPSSCPHTGSLITSLQQSDLSPSSEMIFTTCPSAFSQTEPQDFALLWRINQQKQSEPEPDSSTSGIVILEGNPVRFLPKLNDQKSSEMKVIPYRVCHEKGSQVEENDLKELPFKQNSLEILRCHFKHVPKETLEDLYEKCYRDIEWTTNLLLDSGEHLCRDDDQYAEGCGLVQVSVEESCDHQGTREPKIICTKDTVTEETFSNCCENPAIIVPNNTNSIMSVEPEDINDQGIKLEEPDQRQHANEPAGENKALKDSLHTALESKVPEGEVIEKYLDGGLQDEIEEDKETKEVKTLSLLEEMECKKEEQRKEKEKEGRGQRKNGPMDIQTLELKLTTELALQLTELFGPVGISPGEFSSENCSVLMDLNVAKLLHQKWKETIQEKHRQAALSYHLLQESSVHWGESQSATAGLRDSDAHFLFGADGYSSLGNQSAFQEGFPFMDHWNVSRPPVSLRGIMLEEQVLQDSLEKSRLSRWDLDKKDGAAVVKEKQLFALFPTIDRHFLRDIFRDHNYSLEQTEQFLHTLLDDEPVRTVAATESVPGNNEKRRVSSKERKQKNVIDSVQFQDIEDPEYEDFRTEATLQRRRQQECFDKAAEAHRQGRKDVAVFYANQGHLHGQKMKEANHRAAVQIFERVNSTLLPQNILDLHGLHVNEALHHLQQVLANKTTEWQQGLCRPQLSVITGRGNHSQGGVARIRPAVLDYLRSQHFKYTEPKEGLVIVMLHCVDY
ncbi:NEDD4-binding protein 2 isoform X3 [Tachysurus vachellii]|uniref:NEDD4-binding protein 2 isoform X3 n=1 Tax=Tachysurus vachellii TaxID=175792 RepID=UPI00296B02EB|nr:NEDD4-binding protein 2 isoform X3 [Tachysurus vachellii]